ncbi:MAG: Zn-ribbon containing protein [Halobacteriaceae archaeon]
MPHQCTECGHSFPDGSTDMLSGCPDCGGNKFQYFPGEVPDEPPEEEPPEPTDPGVSGTVGKATRTVKDLVGTGSESPPGPEATATENAEPTPGRDPPEPSPGVDEESTVPTVEDDAQRAARSEVVDTADLPEPDNGEVVDRPSGRQPDLAELREELNDQFESIRIVEPGQYELNLMELYDREEYIIALQENGRYVIEVPDAWHDEA